MYNHAGLYLIMIESENYVQSICYACTSTQTCALCRDTTVHKSRKVKAVDVLIVAQVHYVWVLLLKI